jgi:hypothetical protein
MRWVRLYSKRLKRSKIINFKNLVSRTYYSPAVFYGTKCLRKRDISIVEKWEYCIFKVNQIFLTYNEEKQEYSIGLFILLFVPFE